MNLQKKIKDNVVLHYVEHNNYFNIDDKSRSSSYELSFTYFGINYIVRIKESDLEDDYLDPYIDGDSELYNSFKDACESYLEEPIREAIEAHKEWIKQFDNEEL